jgi:hypothetical protein
MKQINFKLMTVLAAVFMAGFASCDDGGEPENDSVAYWKQWESSMSSQGYAKGWPKDLLGNRLHNALADTLRLVLDNKDLVYYIVQS